MSKENDQHIAAQQKTVAQVAQYYYNPNGEVHGFDSLGLDNAPDVLKSLFDSIGIDQHKNVHGAVSYGVEQYKARNGGEMPHPQVIASALAAAAVVAKNADPAQMAQFDSIDNMQHESFTIVQAMPVVTIASLISSAIPVVTQIPNINGANLVPLVAARFTASQSIGAIKAGDYLDSEKASLPYVSGRMKFAMVQAGATAVYDVTSRIAYADFALKTPDATSALAPFVPNHVSIRVNGVELANSALRREEDRKGSFTLIPKGSIFIAGVEYKVVGSDVDFDAHTVQVTFNTPLPDGVTVYAHLVLDYERKDANKNRLIPLAGVSIKPEYGELLAAPVHFEIEANINTLTQVANELNVGFVAAALAILQGKFYLEQSARLLIEGRDRAVANGRTVTFDASRGVSGNLTATYNNTGQLIAELIKHIAMAQLQIRQASGGATVGFDLFVGDSGAIFFQCMPREFFTLTNTPLAGHNEIVRLGTLNNGTNVYHSPNSNGVITEGDKTSMGVLVGRGNEPVRNPFLSHTASPMQVLEARPDPFEVVVGAHARIAADVNPLERYADQVAVIEMINLPSLGVA